MKPEIKQLLQHEDHANRLIGCWLAWHDGYGTIDIFDCLPFKDMDSTTVWKFDKYLLRVNHFVVRGASKWIEPTTATHFIIIDSKIKYGNKLVQNHTIKTNDKESKLYQETFNHFKHMFIEYILNEE